jgi:hypothetical protein
LKVGRGLRQHLDVRARAEELLARARDDDDVHRVVHARAQDGASNCFIISYEYVFAGGSSA